MRTGRWHLQMECSIDWAPMTHHLWGGMRESDVMLGLVMTLAAAPPACLETFHCPASLFLPPHPKTGLGKQESSLRTFRISMISMLSS